MTSPISHNGSAQRPGEQLGSSGSNGSSGSTGSALSPKQTGTTADQGQAAGDRVAVSDAARNISRLNAQLRSEPPVNEAKVAELKSAIAEGRYHVDPGRIAANFLSLEAQLTP